jgi:hypothetical protein
MKTMLNAMINGTMEVCAEQHSEVVNVKDLPEAVTKWKRMRDDYCIANSDLFEPVIVSNDQGKMIARIEYNGKITLV